MAFYAKGAKGMAGQIGLGAVATSTSILFGRFASSPSNTNAANQVASKKLNSLVQSHFGSFANRSNFNAGAIASSFARSGGLQQQQRHFSSSIAKDATASVNKPSKGFVEWYEGHLSSRPVATKAVTGGILWGLGDFVAQVVPPMFQESSPKACGDDGSNESSTSSEVTAIVPQKEFKYDFPRTARAVTFGFAIHAPLSHLHYNFLEWMTVKAGFTGLSIPVFKTIMEQFVYWSWFSNSLYHGAMGAMQGMNLSQIYDRIKDVLWDTQVAQWSFWIPVQLLNFQFVPVRHQLNVVLLTSVVWTALLSAWYPPQVEKTEVNVKIVEANNK